MSLSHEENIFYITFLNYIRLTATFFKCDYLNYALLVFAPQIYDTYLILTNVLNCKFFVVRYMIQVVVINQPRVIEILNLNFDSIRSAQVELCA